jgi:hypothetical protein
VFAYPSSGLRALKALFLERGMAAISRHLPSDLPFIFHNDAVGLSMWQEIQEMVSTQMGESRS